MSNKNNLIVAENPFSSLSKTEIDLFYILVNWKTHLSANKMLDEDGGFEISNAVIANSLEKTIFTASRSVKKLEKEKYITLKYTPHGKGLIRKIFLIK